MKVSSVQAIHPGRTTTTTHNQSKKPAVMNEGNDSKVTQHQEKSERLPVKNVTYKHPQSHDAKKHLDAEDIKKLQERSERAFAPLKAMIRDMLRQQGIRFRERADLIDPAEDVVINPVDTAITMPGADSVEESNDWGVQETADRIVNFAKALAGDDPSKAALLRDAVEQGFAEAEKAFGGALPQISRDTYDEIMRQFDEWENGTA